MPIRTERIRKKRNGMALFEWQSQGIYIPTPSEVSFDYTNSVSSGGPVPQWREKIKVGEDATTLLQGVRYTMRKYKTVTSVVEQTNGVRYSCVGYPTAGDLPYFPSPLYSPTTKAQTEAEQNFAKSYRKITRKAQGGNFLAEIVDTARLLRNPVKGMFDLTKDFTRALRRGKGLPARRYATFLSDAWLTYSFGMKPLISDADDYALALRALASGRNFELARCYGTGNDWSDLGTFIGSANMTGGGAPWESEHNRVRKCSVTIRGAVKIQGEVPPLTTFGLSTLDIVPAVWEAIPFSFLVDYFTNVGETLETSMLRLVHFSWLNETVRNSLEANFKAARPYKPNFGEKRRYSYGGEASFATRTVTRQSRDNDFGGPLHLKAPGLGSMKWLNISALVTSIGLSRPR